MSFLGMRCNNSAHGFYQQVGQIAPNDTHHKMPPHWQLPESTVGAFLFRALCLLSVSRPSLDYHWQSKVNEQLWQEHKTLVNNRLNNSNVVGGLILTSSAVFLTTMPPLPQMLPYTSTAPYLFAITSFAHALGGILTGTAVVVVYDSCDRVWARDVWFRPIRTITSHDDRLC
ncbi:hypothetical protein HYDPIDRAFT_27651 [Hydnomerulius pinastri MD-312]|nr:hypothetical protein HYDPIDRAFT_27651 [Hydnomerulius pinastri MD-312]